MNNIRKNKGTYKETLKARHRQSHKPETGSDTHTARQTDNQTDTPSPTDTFTVREKHTQRGRHTKRKTLRTRHTPKYQASPSELILGRYNLIRRTKNIFGYLIMQGGSIIMTRKFCKSAEQPS